MKKLICYVLLLLSATTYAQPGPKWSTGGNATSPGEILGTTNNQPLNLVTNNNIRAIIDANGQFQINNLAGVGDRFLKVDANGSLIAFPNGNATDILYGNGNWGALPGGATSWQLVGSNLLSTNTGNIGIGTNNPTFKLDVVGSVRISSNLFVGGGIITTSVVNSTSQLNAGDVNATNNLNVMGNTTLSGSLTLPALATGSVNIFKEVFVDAVGNMMVGPNPPEGFPTGCIATNPSWRIGGNTILGLSPPMSEWSAGTCDNYPFVLKSNNVPKIWLTNTAYNGYIGFGTPVPSERYHFYSGNILLDGGNMVLNSASQAGTGFNKLRLSGAQDNVGLLVETTHITPGAYAAKFIVDRNETKAISMLNTYADVNGLENFLVWGDGKTNVGFQAGSPNSAKLNVNVFAGGNAFNIYNQTTNQVCYSLQNNGVTEIVTNVPNITDNIFTIRDGTQPNTPSAVNFKIRKNGKTIIGSQTQAGASPHTDAMLTVYGKMVSTSCYIRINDWADYVFDENYKLPNLYNIEAYYKENKHLEGIPSEKEVLDNGIDVGQMNKLLLKKIEEMTILMVQQQKEIDILKSKIK